MALFRGPNVVRDGLVLYLDAANRKSCGGQPTTNLLTYTSDISNGVWIGYCGPKSNLTYNTSDVTDPIGTNTAIKIVRNSQAGCYGVGDVAMGVLYSIGSDILIAGGTYTTSIYARGAVGGENIVHGLNDSHNIGITLTTSWVRYSYTFSNISGTDRGFQVVNYNTNQTYYIWAPQTQQGAYLGPYAASGVSNGTANLTWRDLTSNANNGTQTNNPAFISSNGGSILYDGTNDYTYQSLFLNSVTTTLSFDIWVKFNDTGSPGRYIMALGRDVGGPAGGIALIAYGFASASSGQILFEFGSGYGRVSSGIVPTTGIWYNLTVTADGSNTKFYVNGVLKNTASQTTGAVTSSPGLSIGSYLNSSTPPTPGTYFLNGNVGSVKIYNRGLTAAEVLQNYNANKSRFGL